MINLQGQYQQVTPETILQAIEEQDVRFIALWFTDITGLVKSVMLPATQMENVLENGSHFDGSSIEGFARQAESDMVLVPDLATFTILPWTDNDDKTARLICSVYTTNGDPFIGDPRTVLTNILAEAEEMGFIYKTGMELEFFLFQLDKKKRPILKNSQDIASYFDLPDIPVRILRRKMLETLVKMGIRVDSTHSETGSGQHEIDFQYNDALVSADNILSARVAMKTVALQHQMYCTFMPRPLANMPGSGMHTHQSLHNLTSGENVFVALDDEYGLSKTARHFLAGQLHHARAMCAVLAPLVNSYKRLGKSFEAPINVTWAHINRGALIRVPSTASGKEFHKRLELRCPDPTSNPYLMKAVMLAAGLDGIRQQTPLPEPIEESFFAQQKTQRRTIETLPQSLDEALDVLSQNEVILSALGHYLSDRYIAVKRQEYEDYNQHITSWELERYLTRF